MFLRRLVSTVFVGQLISDVAFAVPTARQSGKVGVLDIVIPPNRNDDQYYIVRPINDLIQWPKIGLTAFCSRISISRTKPFPFSSTRDLEIFSLGPTNATPPIHRADAISARFMNLMYVQVYRSLQKSYEADARTQNKTVIVPNETFGTVVGVGGVNGNQSIMSVDFGGVEIGDLAVRKCRIVSLASVPGSPASASVKSWYLAPVSCVQRTPDQYFILLPAASR